VYDLTGRVAVVTGGNGGIGLGIGRALGRAGSSLAIWARDEAKSERAVAALGDEGIEAAAFTCDVSSEAAVQAAMDATVERFARVDVMVANAGFGLVGPIHEMPLERWRAVMAVNLDGAFLCLRAAAAHMIDRGDGGAMIAVTSTSAIHGAPANEAYAASKAGLGALIRGMAVELARYGVRCNVLMPGWTETDMTAPLRGWEKFMENTTNRTPVRRWGTPDDMGAAAVFLADPTLTFHTGDTVVVDGGYTVF
jgi:NAD(P)-dependent dehydrogenase (short-subunit alcohol dehydrogenase family)